MISLPAIETTLSHKRKNDDGTDCLAIEAEEKD
jgi:hypothetical protein